MKSAPVQAVVFDVGRVIIQWGLRHLFAQLIADAAELDWFVANVVTEEWHFEHDQGRALDDMLAERKALFPDHHALIDAYRARFLETIPGPVPGTAALIERLAARDVPLFCITNFGAEFWPQFRPTVPVLEHFRDIIVSGDEVLAKPDAAIFDLAVRRFGYQRRQCCSSTITPTTSPRRMRWAGRRTCSQMPRGSKPISPRAH
jgi:2-haloacid dehalogenase